MLGFIDNVWSTISDEHDSVSKVLEESTDLSDITLSSRIHLLSWAISVLPHHIVEKIEFKSLGQLGSICELQCLNWKGRRYILGTFITRNVVPDLQLVSVDHLSTGMVANTYRTLGVLE